MQNILNTSLSQASYIWHAILTGLKTITVMNYNSLFMQGPSENWFLPPRPLVKVKQKYANGIKLENKFSQFNNKEYFKTEIDPMPIEEGVIRTKNKTWKRIKYGKAWVRKSKKKGQSDYPKLEDRSRQKYAEY